MRQGVATDVLAIDTSTLAMAVPLAVMALIAAWLVLRAWRARHEGTGAVNWVEVPGTVLMSTIQVQRAGAGRHEIPVVVYSYQVNGVTLQGNRVRVGDELARQRGASTAADSAAQTIARYPVGAAVRVLCNPKDPAQSALEH